MFISFLNHSRHIGALALPLILTNFAYVGIATIDLIMLGTLSPLELAAGGLAIAIFNQFRTMGTGVVTATGNLVADAVGRDELSVVSRLLNASFLCSTTMGLIFMTLMCLLEKPLMYLGQAPEVAEKTVNYLMVAAAGMLPCLWFQSIRHFSVGLKAPGPLLLITLASMLLTALLNYALIFGAWGLPKLGFIGVAVATLIVLILSFLAFVAVALRHPVLARHLSWRIWQTDRASLSATWKMGLPIAMTYGTEAGFFTLLMLLVGSLGVNELAAHTIVNQWVYMVFMVSAGISSAASVCISEAYARKDQAVARQLGLTAMILGLAAMALVALVYLWVPQWLLWVFMSSEEFGQSEILSIAMSLLAIAAVLQLFDASQNIGLGILRGIGDVKSPLKLSILGYWLVGLPVAWLACQVFSASVQGVWYGLMLGLAVTAIAQLWVFVHKTRPPSSASCDVLACDG